MKYIQKLQDKGIRCGSEVVALFAGELNPVAPKAQKKVPVPEGWVVVNSVVNEIIIQKEVELHMEQDKFKH